jgi:hypothetical protein
MRVQALNEGSREGGGGPNVDGCNKGNLTVLVLVRVVRWNLNGEMRRGPPHLMGSRDSRLTLAIKGSARF